MCSYGPASQLTRTSIATFAGTADASLTTYSNVHGFVTSNINMTAWQFLYTLTVLASRPRSPSSAVLTGPATPDFSCFFEVCSSLIPVSVLCVAEVFFARSTTSQTSTLMISGVSGKQHVSEVSKSNVKFRHSTFVLPLDI